MFKLYIISSLRYHAAVVRHKELVVLSVRCLRTCCFHVCIILIGRVVRRISISNPSPRVVMQFNLQ